MVLWYYDNAVLWYQKNPVLVLTWEIRSSTMVTDVEKQKDYNSVDLPHNSNYVVGRLEYVVLTFSMNDATASSSGKSLA